MEHKKVIITVNSNGKRIGKKYIRPFKTCSACGGSGRYDITNSPKCEVCKGTGRENR